jgi:hypothetical protein
MKDTDRFVGHEVLGSEPAGGRLSRLVPHGTPTKEEVDGFWKCLWRELFPGKEVPPEPFAPPRGTGRPTG